MRSRVSIIPVGDVIPSPYQSRKSFSANSLKELAKSIQRDGLIEPIVVRRRKSGYELIAGERRLRAVRDHSEGNLIMARVVEANDLQARRMCAAENMQREDLASVEQVEALVELIDAELIEDDEYKAEGDDPKTRVRRLLGFLDSVRSSQDRGSEVDTESQRLFGKFAEQVTSIFTALPRPVDWQSFRRHDLALVTSIDDDVREIAIANKLNKSQAKALNDLKRKDEEAYEALTEDRSDDGIVLVDTDALSGPIDGGPIPLAELSAREIARKAEPSPSLEREWASVKAAPPLPAGKFDVVYADPPWDYDFMKVNAWAVEKTYQTMSLDDLMAMGDQVKEMTVPSSVLFMWGTSPKLREALAVMAAWGFEYKTSLVWIKHRNRAGMGYWGRIGHELLLIGARELAHPPPPARRFPSVVADPDAGTEEEEEFELPSVIEAPKGAHSEKPEEMRHIIEQMFPDASRVELFAREVSEGWTAWGNEV